jgi:hypothetical protein
MKCLVCELESSLAGKQCKMCGMGTENPINHSNFLFCCSKCVGHFEYIYAGADSHERDRMLKESILI